MIKRLDKGPTLRQKVLRALGRTHIPKLEGLYSRLGVLEDADPRTFECRFDGMRYMGRLDQRIDKHVYYFGSYSPAELDFLGRAAVVMRRRSDKVTFTDIGANVGQHTLYMARRVSSVLAFEPGDEAADQLAYNVQLNGLSNVQLARYALGREDGLGELGSGFPGNNGSRSLKWSLDLTKNTPISVRRGDDVLRQYGISRGNIIKMDVEGCEKEVLAGMPLTLVQDRPIILFELVGDKVKGGFRSEDELKAHLYPDHVLYSLRAGRKAALAPFSWSGDEAISIPAELCNEFQSMVL